MFGLIFDLDGVLADTESLSEAASIKMFQDLYGVEVQAEDFHPFRGTGARRYVEGVAEEYNVPIDTDEAVEARHVNFERLLETSGHLDLPGARELIDTARAAKNWKLAIATSSPEKKARKTLAAAGIVLKDFDVFINGDMVTKTKPDPAVFLMTAERLELPPEQCVVIEDAVTGVAAAKAAHMGCIAVTNSFTGDQLAKADFVVTSLEDVTLDLLRRAVERHQEPSYPN